MSSVHQDASSAVAIKLIDYNEHLPVQKDGFIALNLPLGLIEKQHYGFPRFEVGTYVGPKVRYGISRKTGWESSASFWAAFDEQYVHLRNFYHLGTKLTRSYRESKCVAVEALPGYAPPVATGLGGRA